MNLEKYGPWALITGGSEGIGAAFARKLAAAKINVIITARKQEALDKLAEEIRNTYGVEVRALSVDLSQTDALEKTRTVTDDVEVGSIWYTAGANEFRHDFLDMDPKIYRSVITINVTNQVEFTRHYGGKIKERGHGGIILTGSSSNFCGAATLAPYTAAKAFSRIFTESLWAECQGTGIDVLHMSINFTATPAMMRLGLDVSVAQPPEDVADEALAHLGKGPLVIHAGQRALDTAIARSQLENRGDVINKFATPRREEIKHVDKADA